MFKSPTEHVRSIFEAAFSIFQLPEIHSVCPPKFCITYCCEMLLEGLHIPKSIFHNNNFCKRWEVNSVSYGQCETFNRELPEARVFCVVYYNGHDV